MKTKILSSIIVSFLPIIIFVITKNPLLSTFKLALTILSFVLFLVCNFFLKKRLDRNYQTKSILLSFAVFILFLVGTTGWFFSPFFFSLYLLSILFAFIFSLQTAIGFSIALIALFSFNIGEVDLTYDLLTVLSLLTVIPLSYYLRKEYLKIKESTKEILILEKQQNDYKNTVEKALSNKVNKFATELKQPINDIKQLSYFLKNKQNKISRQDLQKELKKLIVMSEEALINLKKFEEETTGKKLLSTPSSPLKSSESS